MPSPSARTDSVVKLAYYGEAIAVISLEEKEHRNTFTPAFIDGLHAAFATITEISATKVVIVQGYEQYFCCGGTQEELLQIFNGELTFDQLDFFRLLLDCELPTIAAMQGHTLGGGLAFACYADLLVMAEESIYSANFMRYGFTPGMGATFIIPRRLGTTLGNEMLLTAKNYRGHELKARGASPCFAPRKAVLETAIRQAETLAEKPLTSLKILKQHLVTPIRQALPRIIEQELAMHSISFQQPEVKERIEALFHA
jgi:polyketide biosynthesis enoyl-CoA hydratase PksI